MIHEIKKYVLLSVILPVCVVGLAFAADARIDQRVQSAIINFQQQEIERKIDFYIIKEGQNPEAMTADDKINRQILEKQLEKIRSQQ